jgi:hypothetical protein
MLLPSAHLPWPSPSFCLTVCLQHLTPKNIFRFKILRVPSHPLPLLLVTLKQRCNQYGSPGRPPGSVSTSMAFVPQKCVETTCWCNSFGIKFSCFSNVSIPLYIYIYIYISYAQPLTQGVPQKSSYSRITNHATAIPMYSTYTGISQNSSCAKAYSLVVNY